MTTPMPDVIPAEQELCRSLYAAFAPAPRPPRDRITLHRCGECDEVAARLAAHESRAVPDEDMFWLGDSMPP